MMKNAGIGAAISMHEKRLNAPQGVIMQDPGRSLIRTTIGGPGPELSVAVLGSGEPMLLLHGIGSGAMSWMPVMVGLARQYQLFMPDLRGHGSSGHPASGYTLEDYADDLDRLVEYVRTPPIIIGHSLGAITAITWAKRRPAQARAIVLEDMPLSGSPERAHVLTGWSELAARSVPDVIEHYRANYPDWSEADFRRRAEIITATDQNVFIEMRDQTMTGEGVDYLTGMAAITSPVHLIYGDTESGSHVPEAGARQFAALGSNFSVARIEGASHTIHRDATAAFLKALSTFLADLP